MEPVSILHVQCIPLLNSPNLGTAVGDPEELKSLDEFFCTNRDRPLYIGAVKSNIGHNEPTSGLCSVVKVTLH